MSYTTQLKYIPMQSLSSASVTGSYQNLGSILSKPAAIVKIVNNSTQSIVISIDGINDHDICPSDSFFLYDCVTNHPTSTPGVFIPQGTQFMVKGTAGTGTIYLVVLYIKEGIYESGR